MTDQTLLLHRRPPFFKPDAADLYEHPWWDARGIMQVHRRAGLLAAPTPFGHALMPVPTQIALQVLTALFHTNVTHRGNGLLDETRRRERDLCFFLPCV